MHAHRSAVALLTPFALLLALACDPAFSRPRLTPGPEAVTAQVRGDIASVTTRIAEALTAEGIPLARVESRDGWLTTAWLDTAGYGPASSGARGLDAVRIRGWIDPGGYGASRVTLEGVWRPVADPSLPERERERALPAGHPTLARVRAALERVAGPLVTPAGPPPASQ